MDKTLLIARLRSTGKDIILADTNVSFPEQRAMYLEFNSQVNEKYESVSLVTAEPALKPLRFFTQAQMDKRAKDQKAAEQAEENAKKQKPALKGKQKSKSESGLDSTVDGENASGGQPEASTP